MITLTKLNDVKFVLNCELIETIQENPDTTIHLSNGSLYIVKEPMQEVLDETIRYKRLVLSNLIGGNRIGEGR